MYAIQHPTPNTQHLTAYSIHHIATSLLRSCWVVVGSLLDRCCVVAASFLRRRWVVAVLLMRCCCVVAASLLPRCCLVAASLLRRCCVVARSSLRCCCVVIAFHGMLRELRWTNLGALMSKTSSYIRMLTHVLTQRRMRGCIARRSGHRLHVDTACNDAEARAHDVAFEAFACYGRCRMTCG